MPAHERKRLAEMMTWSDRKLFWHAMFYGSALIVVPLLLTTGGLWMAFYRWPLPGLAVATTGLFCMVHEPLWRIVKQLWRMRP